MHAKQAQLPSGERVQVRAKEKSFRWSDKVVEHQKDLYTEKFGQEPACLSGDLEADNLGAFQQSYDKLRMEHPEWTEQHLSNEAVRETPFGKTREKFGYGDFDVTATKPQTVTVKDRELQDVPTKVRVEATPSSGTAEQVPQATPSADAPSSPSRSTEDR